MPLFLKRQCDRYPLGSSRWYSFELGPVHFTMFDTDAYGFDEVPHDARHPLR